MPNTTFSIALDVLTNDKLRKIHFKLVKALVKDTEDVDADKDKDEIRVNWTLEFALSERKKATDKFDEEHNISLKVDISKELEKKAEATLKNGWDDAQTSAAVSSGDSFKLWKANKISEKSFKGSLARVISRRSS